MLISGLFVKSANPPKYRACQQNQGFGHSRYESRRSRNVASKNNENRSPNRPEIFENRVSGPPGRPCRSTFAARSASVEQLGQLGAMRVCSDGPGEPDRASIVPQHARARPGRQAALGNINLEQSLSIRAIEPARAPRGARSRPLWRPSTGACAPARKIAKPRWVISL